MHPKQLDTHLTAPVVLTGIVVGSAIASSNITTPLTTALNTAGRNNTSVPVQVSSTIDTTGVALSARIGKIRVFDEATNEPPQASGGEEIYGVLTESGGVYTVTWNINDGAGGDQAENLPAATYTMVVGYNFSFEQLPNDALFAARSFAVGDDPTVAGAAGESTTIEVLAVTALNTLAALSTAPNATPVALIINGIYYTELETGITQSGTSITWNATNMTFDLETTDRVIAVFRTG